MPSAVVDYTQAPPFEEGDLACKPTGKGLKCTSKAGDAEENTWTTFGPVHPVGAATPTHVEARFSMRWGGSSGVAFGVTDT